MEIESAHNVYEEHEVKFNIATFSVILSYIYACNLYICMAYAHVCMHVCVDLSMDSWLTRIQ